MMDEILLGRRRKHTPDLNIVPILDMLTTVIFFLLISTSFVEYTKLTLPPSSTVVEQQTEAEKNPPLSPKLLIRRQSQGFYSSELTWMGAHPSRLQVEMSESELREKVGKQLQDFAQHFPEEKTLQIGLDPGIPYQVLIQVMDATGPYLPNSVLISYPQQGGV
ncbi:MAG: ExbD/TolR family protein [Bdellovibrionia bacterium]